MLKVRAITGSMAPLVDAGDTALVLKCPHGSVKIGDIVAFQSKQTVLAQDGSVYETHYTIHRVAGFRNDGDRRLVIEKGDRGTIFGWIDDKRIIGKVLLIKKSGYLIDLHAPGWRAANLLFSISMVLEYYFSRLFSLIRKALPVKWQNHFTKAVRAFYWRAKKITHQLFFYIGKTLGRLGGTRAVGPN